MDKEEKKSPFLAGFCILAPYFDSIFPHLFFTPFNQECMQGLLELVCVSYIGMINYSEMFCL